MSVCSEAQGCRPPGLQIVHPPPREVLAAGLAAGEGLPAVRQLAQLARAVFFSSQQLGTGLLVFAVVMGASALGVLAGQVPPGELREISRADRCPAPTGVVGLILAFGLCLLLAATKIAALMSLPTRTPSAPHTCGRRRSRSRSARPRSRSFGATTTSRFARHIRSRQCGHPHNCRAAAAAAPSLASRW